MLVILPNQLFEKKYLPKDIKTIKLIEEPIYFGDRNIKMNFNKLKLLLHRASMKCYYDYLKKNNYNVSYIEYNNINYEKIFDSDSFMFKPYDYFLESKIKKYNIEYLENPNFLLSTEQINKYHNKHKNKSRHDNFYKFVKSELDILTNTKSYDKMNREALPNNIKIPPIKRQKSNKYIKEGIKYINKNFNKNYGNINNFIYPITHKTSELWLDTFIKERISNFGKYQDAIDDKNPFLFHSVISPMMNIGLLMPQQVIEKLQKYKDNISINNYEGFIRQIIGWREYQRYCYCFYYDEMINTNIFNNTNKINEHFYNGTTGVDPVDTSIKFAFEYGYLHHIMRLMVMGNFMNLCMISPNEIYKWFMEFSCDSYDWVMIQNVYSMATWSDKGLTMTKPYISTDNYIFNMSNFKKGKWNIIWKSLFYNFISKNKSIIRTTPYKNNINYFEKLNNQEKSKLLYDGQEYIKSLFSAKN